MFFEKIIVCVDETVMHNTAVSGSYWVTSSVDHPPQSTKPIQANIQCVWQKTPIGPFDRGPHIPHIVIYDHKWVIKLFQTKQHFTIKIKDGSLRHSVGLNVTVSYKEWLSDKREPYFLRFTYVWERARYARHLDCIKHISIQQWVSCYWNILTPINQVEILLFSVYGWSYL